MKIGLFIPCFVNAVYPQVGTASFKLLRSLGVDVDYPLGQTCCGQPMANGGFEKDSAPLARNMEKLFKDYDYVVGPSGSCVAFVKEHYPEAAGYTRYASSSTTWCGLRNCSARIFPTGSASTTAATDRDCSDWPPPQN